jgi:hypothetical protein
MLVSRSDNLRARPRSSGAHKRSLFVVTRNPSDRVLERELEKLIRFGARSDV